MDTVVLLMAIRGIVLNHVHNSLDYSLDLSHEYLFSGILKVGDISWTFPEKYNKASPSSTSSFIFLWQQISTLKPEDISHYSEYQVRTLKHPTNILPSYLSLLNLIKYPTLLF